MVIVVSSLLAAGSTESDDPRGSSDDPRFPGTEVVVVVGPARIAQRRTRVPVYTFRTEPGVPPVWAMRLDEAALVGLGATSHVHDFPGLVFLENTGEAMLIRPGELVEVDAAELLSGGGWGLYFTPAALAGTGQVDARLAWYAHPLLWPFVAHDAREPLRFVVPPGDRPAWGAGMATVAREVRERRAGYREATLGHLVLLLVAAGRLLAEARTPGSTDRDLLDRVYAVIERRYAGHLSLADVAAEVHLSPGHLTTTVRERSGRTVQEWIAERRLAEARRLLVETDLPVQEVGRRVGYPDPGYFGRVFRQAHGVTPRAWRLAR